MQKLLATLIAWAMYQANHILRFMADALTSTTLDRLSSQYSNWYNLELVSRLLNFANNYKGVKTNLKVASQETLNDLIIVHLNHSVIPIADLDVYLISKLQIVYGVDPDTIQISHLTPTTTKLVFPIIATH